MKWHLLLRNREALLGAKNWELFIYNNDIPGSIFCVKPNHDNLYYLKKYKNDVVINIFKYNEFN